MATYAETAEKFEITPEQARQLKQAMSMTWGQIAWDWINCFESEDAAYEAYGSEAAMIAEATIDADRVSQFNPGFDLEWVYKTPDGEHRDNCIEMAEAVWNCRR